MTAEKSVRRRTPGHRLTAVAAVAAAGLLLAACGGGDKHTEHAERGFNTADVSFAQMMIPHHRQAVEMARLAEGRASDKQITTLAGRIEKAQDPEIRTMASWLKTWGKPQSPSPDAMSGMHHGSEGSGMMSDKDMAGLKAADGRDFDRAFATMMIGHHQGAITMAKDERKNGRDAAARKLADDVVKDQSAEVTTLRKILDRL